MMTKMCFGTAYKDNRDGLPSFFPLVDLAAALYIRGKHDLQPWQPKSF